MGQRTGLSDIYFKPTIAALFKEYKKAIPFLTIATGNRKQFEVEEMKEEQE